MKWWEVVLTVIVLVIMALMVLSTDVLEDLDWVETIIQMFLYAVVIVAVGGFIWVLCSLIGKFFLYIVGVLVVVLVIWLGLSWACTELELGVTEARLEDVRTENKGLRDLVDTHFGGEDLVAKCDMVADLQFTYFACLIISPILGLISGVFTKVGRAGPVISASLVLFAAIALLVGTSCAMQSDVVAAEVIATVGGLSPQDQLLLSASTVANAKAWAGAMYGATAALGAFVSAGCTFAAWAATSRR